MKERGRQGREGWVGRRNQRIGPVCLAGVGGWGRSGRGLWGDTRRPATERMSMMVSTVSNRTALPAFRLVSVLVAT